MRFLLAALLVHVLTIPALAQEPAKKIPILLDCDIGDDIDDTFALATILASPELELRGVTTVGEDSYKRAQMACRFLTAVGRGKIPVAAGLPEKTTKPLAYWQVQYANHASVYFRDPKPAKERAPAFLYKHLKASPGELTIVAVGPLSNIAALLDQYPDSKPMIKRIVMMGGSVRRGFHEGSKPEPEYNIVQDIKAAQAVFQSGIPLTVAPLDATAVAKLDEARQKKLFDAGSLLTLSVQALVQLWQGNQMPVLHDPVAVTLAFKQDFCTMEHLHLTIDDKGFTKEVAGKPANASVALALKKEEFLDWIVDRLARAYPKSLPTGRIVNETKMAERGGFPNRVHAFEDFETDIEKRWWLAGRIETKNVPSGSERALRATLTQDFDDRQGEMKTLYTAVVFNPVPGPPMGKKPHLSFRYYLKGTDVLRVQIYSLTNGYHRCLMLRGLPEGEWREGNLDMRDARKPDGTGGPLSEDERIDDIQFYCDPRAEMLIDDIVLYDAADKSERRPFPTRILFTGWFDTGKQGKEWPGDFEIAPKEGYFWHAAKSVPDPKDEKKAWINIGLRGNRPLGDAPRLFFRYKLEGEGDGAQNVDITLVGPKNPKGLSIVPNLRKGEWGEASLDIEKVAKGDSAEAIVFRIPRAATLWIDDLLLYEARKK
jgi:inosine-uridine nucleoside N-ribohydrolase